MTKNDKPRLCGGTFFTLLLEARGQRMGVREHYLGDTDGLSEPEALLGLAKIVVPDIKEPWPEMQKTIKGNVFEFKSCKTNGGTFFMLGDKEARQAFDNRVQHEYRQTLKAMNIFVDRFVDVGGSIGKDIKLVRALLDLIDQDDSIEDTQPFYICENGQTVSKADIKSETNFCIDSFLLGVWHYALLRKEGNTIGRDTFDEWCPSQNGGRREYVGTMGNALNRKIQISRCVISDTEPEVEEENITYEESVITEEPSVEEPTPSTLQQNVNNPLVFNFTQNGNNCTQIGNIENYYASGKGE